ncbi:MAG: hypothetical protein WCV93_02330 [Candidatus Shapirobacteria bacterium]|jgi:hypothetical protein
MSADNYIFINRKNFEVKLMCASDDSVISDLGKGKDLEEAVDIASESTDELAVEYGIWFGEK